MATNRRRSRSAGAGGLGPFGFFLALAAIGILIQYWWVLLIILGAVGLTVAIVRSGNTPPAVARPQKPTRPPKPGPALPQPSPAPVSEDLAGQTRATKRARHIQGMQEWDYEWIRLTHPERGSREHSEIANAHFAQGRSIGVNYEWAGLDDSAPEPPAEGARVKEDHSVKGESSNEHGASGSDDGMSQVREDAPRVPPAEGKHGPTYGAGGGATAAKSTPSNSGDRAKAEPGELLASDPRAMWAWAEYLEGRLFLPVSGEAARQVLDAIPPGDHVEMFGAVAIGAGLLGGTDTLPQEARFAARTFDRWILPSPGGLAEIIPASSTRHYATAKPADTARWMGQSNFALADGRHLGAYSDRIRVDRFHEGAGVSILRLPDSPLAPAPPRPGTGEEDALIADYANSVSERVRTANANYGSLEALTALREAHGADRSRRAANYLKGAVDAVKRHPRIGTDTQKAIVSHFRNADLSAAFFCQVLSLPYPGIQPLTHARRGPKTAADFY
ncbi:hypothetical protein [Pseudarthrobacter sp. L1SW]|uniref:hypothetical protein n=1 Tax=Pseudarthrobacter sp. L1SW TaxID=2851598 RepID=UPI001E47C1AD|nr:hypothetical protein [Pseudarthrobacter sp. L1SW]UEL29497.1 hypothetical protein KTR40_05075 [Pseudarthrobacter sp. L1SW]